VSRCGHAAHGHGAEPAEAVRCEAGARGTRARRPDRWQAAEACESTWLG
jgi:hypothetical protein